MPHTIYLRQGITISPPLAMAMIFCMLLVERVAFVFCLPTRYTRYRFQELLVLSSKSITEIFIT